VHDLAVVIASVVQFSTSNITTKSSINPGVPNSQVVQYINIDFAAYGMNDTDCESITTDFVGLDLTVLAFKPVDSNTGCMTTYHCTDCNINFGRDVYLQFNFPSTFVAAFGINITIPFFQNKQALLGANIVPAASVPSVFHAGETEFISLLTPATYTDINNLTTQAFLLQFGSVIPGPAFLSDTITNGSVIPPTDTTPLAFRLTFQQSSITFSETETEKSTVLNFISQLLALAGGAISFWQLVMVNLDKLFHNLKWRDPGEDENHNKDSNDLELK